MEGGCSNSAGGGGGGASEFLSNLPSRGFFSSTFTSANPGGLRVYICDHDTSPPENQVIKTNQTNILIRSLMIKNQKGESSSKDGKATAASQSSRKRAADKALDGKAAGKKAMSSSQLGSPQEGGASSAPVRASSAPVKDMQSLTVEKLRGLLREKGLSVKGRKDELIARLKGVNG